MVVEEVTTSTLWALLSPLLMIDVVLSLMVSARQSHKLLTYTVVVAPAQKSMFVLAGSDTALKTRSYRLTPELIGR